METEVPFTDSSKEGRALKNPKKEMTKNIAKKRIAVPVKIQKLNQHTIAEYEFVATNTLFTGFHNCLIYNFRLSGFKNGVL